MVDLTYHKFEYEGKTYTQLEIIDILINLTSTIDLDSWEPEDTQKVEDVLNLFKIIFPSLWW